MNLCDGSNGAVLGWLASEHITGFSTLHAAEADDPKMALQESQRPARLVSNGMAPVRGVRPLETRGQRSDPQGVLQSGPEERHGRQLMGGDRSGRIGSSISARRTRRKPSTREIKAATKEPRLKDDAMRTMVGKEKTGNSNSYMPKNSRGRPVGLRLGHRQLELEVGPWKLSGSNTKDPSAETNKRPLHGCDREGPRFRCPALAKIHLSSPSWKATTPLWDPER